MSPIWGLGCSRHGASLREHPFIMINESSGSAQLIRNITNLVFKASNVINQFYPQWAVRSRSEERSAAKLWSSRVLAVHPYTVVCLNSEINNFSQFIFWLIFFILLFILQDFWLNYISRKYSENCCWIRHQLLLAFHLYFLFTFCVFITNIFEKSMFYMPSNIVCYPKWDGLICHENQHFKSKLLSRVERWPMMPLWNIWKGAEKSLTWPMDLKRI